MDRSARSLLSVSVLVLAVFLAMNYAVQEAALLDWWPALAFVLLALLVWALGRFEMRRVEVPAAPPAYTPPSPVVHEAPAPKVVSAPKAAPTPVVEKAPEPAKPKAAAKPDDLTVIEGIGPKMSAALIAAGIDTYAKLSQSSEDALHAAVQAAGMRLAPSIPTWAEQAAYAAKGDMDGLKAFQGTLKGGRKK